MSSELINLLENILSSKEEDSEKEYDSEEDNKKEEHSEEDNKKEENSEKDNKKKYNSGVLDDSVWENVFKSLENFYKPKIHDSEKIINFIPEYPEYPYCLMDPNYEEKDDEFGNWGISKIAKYCRKKKIHRYKVIYPKDHPLYPNVTFRTGGDKDIKTFYINYII